jgi:hypothetical protein
MSPTTTTTTTTAAANRAAYAVLVAYYAAQDAAPRTKAHAVAEARFKGMCEMLDRVGAAPTSTAVELDLIDAIREAGPRPAWRAVGNTAQHEYDKDVAGALALTLDL